MATVSPTGIYYRTQAEARPTDEAMALSLATSVNNAIGIVPVIPTSISVASGTATMATDGTVSFSSISGLSLNGCFTSNYRNYKVIVNVTVSAGGWGFGLRLRSGTTDLSAAGSYVSGCFRIRTDTNAVINGFSTNLAYFMGASNYAQTTATEVSIFEPMISGRPTGLSGDYYWSETGSLMYWGHSSTNTTGTAAYDGITIVPDGSHTLAGTIKVYGYR